MPKHNNVIPNVHLHKAWERFVRTWFDQPAKKKSRKEKRVKKAARVFPRPVEGLLRPVVRCPSQRYNRKQRLGRGFTLEELKIAGINKRQALGIGISVDHRRTDLNEQTLRENVQRLKTYKSKLVLYPRKSNKPKKGEASKADKTKLSQHKGVVLPIKKHAPKVTWRRITKKELRGPSAYFTLRSARTDARLVGLRKKKAAEKAALAKKP